MSEKNNVLRKYIRKDSEGKYYIIDSDKFDYILSGSSRLETYDFLVDIGVIKEKNHLKYGIDVFARIVNNILDGQINIGRFRIYHVFPGSLSLEDQMKIERKRPYTNKQELIWHLVRFSFLLML